MFDFNKEAGKIGGWLTEAEGLFLYHAAKKVKFENVIVEIGSWKGKSTICLGKGSVDGNKARVYAIDSHIGASLSRKYRKVDTFEEFKQNISKARINGQIEPIRDTSENASQNFIKPIEFIFIDSAHDYKSVSLDCRLWFPKVTDGGILAFHDSWGYVGPNLVTAVLLLASSKIRNPKLVDTITYFEKVQRNLLADRIKNVCFVIYRTIFGIRGPLRLKHTA